METKPKIFKVSNIPCRDERQRATIKFVLKVLKTFTEEDYQNRRELRLFIDKSGTQNDVPRYDLETFKVSVESWLRVKFLKFSDQEIKYIRSKVKDFKPEQDTKGWLLFCLTVEPKPEPPKKERVERVKKVAVVEAVEFEFDDTTDEEE